MRRAWSSAAIVASLAACAGTAFAQAPAPTAPPPANPATPDQSGPQITITLTSGEVIKGTVKGVEPESIVIIHPVLGEVRVPRVGIAKSEPPVDQVLSPPSLQKPQAAPPPPEPKVEPKPEPKKEEPKPAPPPPAPPPPEKKPFVAPSNPFAAIFADDEKSFWLGWNRQVELGLNGTTGPVDAQNYRGFLNLSRASAKMNTNASFSYAYGENNFATTQNRGEASVRNEWKMSKPWSFWANGRGEVDSLRPWDYRVSASTGIGYTFLKNDKWQVSGRLGVGGAREINGENALIPEVGIFAVSMDYKISDKSSLYANTEFYPSGRHWDWDNFRATSRAGMNFIVDPELKMTLRLGVEHRHDSDVLAERANTVDYFVVLGFAF